MLSEIYKAIREDEIIMPAEQTGLGNYAFLLFIFEIKIVNYPEGR